MSQNIITSTIELMGKKYGPGYVTTNGMEGRSHWNFNGDNLEIKYNAYNKFTGKEHNATETYRLTNFRRYYYFDENKEIPTTWQTYADWGNAKYWITLRHYSKHEYNDFFDDVKRSRKDQWALIHNVKWGEGVWAKWMNYVSEDAAQKLQEIFNVDTSTEEYKIAFQENQEEIEEEKREKKQYRLSSISDYFKEPIIKKISFLNNENYLLIDDVEDDIKFIINDKSMNLEEFWNNNLLPFTEQGFKKIDFNDYIRCFDFYGTFKNVNSFGYRQGTSPYKFFEDVSEEIPEYGQISLRNNDQIIFYKDNLDGKLKFKFLVNYGYTGSFGNEEYLYNDVNFSNFREFYQSSGKKRSRKRFFNNDNTYFKLLFHVYKHLFIFLNQNISNMDIKGIDLNDKVLVFPLFKNNINITNDDHLEKIEQWMKDNKTKYK